MQSSRNRQLELLEARLQFFREECNEKQSEPRASKNSVSMHIISATGLRMSVAAFGLAHAQGLKADK